MTTMPAYRSPETDPKDTADQIVVTKDDTEHTYARLARTRAIRLTQHEKLCDSNRSPPPSRCMSRSMPLPRRCTSQAEESGIIASHITPRRAYVHRPNFHQSTPDQPFIESILADDNDPHGPSFGPEVSRDSLDPDRFQKIHVVDKPDRPCHSDHDPGPCTPLTCKQNASGPGVPDFELDDPPKAEPAQAIAEPGVTNQQEQERMILDAALRLRVGAFAVRRHVGHNETTSSTPLATKVLKPAPGGPAGVCSLARIDPNGNITSDIPKERLPIQAEMCIERQPGYKVWTQADAVAQNARAFVTYESFGSTSITKTREVSDAAVSIPSTVSDAADSYVEQETDMPDQPKPETVTTTADPELDPQTPELDPQTPEHYSYDPITRQEKDAQRDYLKDFPLYLSQEKTYQLSKDSNNLPNFTDTRAGNGYGMSLLPQHTPSTLHKYFAGLQGIFDTHSLDSRAGVQEAVQSLIDSNFVTGDPRLKFDNARNIIAACFYMLKPTVGVLEACADTQAGVVDAETTLRALSDSLILHRDLYAYSNGSSENYSRYLDVVSEITEREKEYGTLEELFTRFRSMIEVLTQDNYSRVLLASRRMAAAFEQLFRFSALAQWVIQEAEKPARPDGVSDSTRQDLVQRLAASQVYLRNTSATLEALKLWLADLVQAIHDAPDFRSLLTSATFIQLLSHSPVYTERTHRGAIRKLEGPRQISWPAPAVAAPEGFPNLGPEAATAPTLLRVAAARLPSDTSMPDAAFYTPLDQATYPTPPNSPESDEEFWSIAEMLDENEILELFRFACGPDAEPAASDPPGYETAFMRFKRDHVRTVLSNPNSAIRSLSAEDAPDRRPWRVPTPTPSDHALPSVPLAASLRKEATVWTPDAPPSGHAYSHVIPHASGATDEPNMFSYLAFVTQPLQIINAWAGEPTEPCSPPTSPLATSLEAEVILVEHATNPEPVMPQFPPAEKHTFVPISAPTSTHFTGPLTTENATPKHAEPAEILRPATPSPIKPTSPSSYYNEAAFDSPEKEEATVPLSSMPPLTPTPTANPNVPETDLVTPDLPAGSEVLIAPPAPASLPRAVPIAAPTRRRRLELGHLPIDGLGDNSAWGAEPSSIESGACDVEESLSRASSDHDDAAPEPRTQPLPEPRSRHQSSTTNTIDISPLVEEERNRTRGFRDLATNNLHALLADKDGARCFHCLARPGINPGTQTVDESTVICPLCGVDAVVPASEVTNEATLHAWRYLAFFERSKPEEAAAINTQSNENRTPELSSHDWPTPQPATMDSTAEPKPKDPPTPPRSLPEPSEVYSQASSQGNLPAAYVDGRPLTVAFKGDASGATVIIVGGATAPIESGGNGMQANQDITINASRCQVHPRPLGPQGPAKLEHLDGALESPLSWRRIVIGSPNQQRPSPPTSLNKGKGWTSTKWNRPSQRTSPTATPSKRPTPHAAKEWRPCGHAHVFASVMRPGQSKAAYVPSWQAQLWDEGKGEWLRGLRRYILAEAVRDVAELAEQKCSARAGAQLKEKPSNPVRPAHQHHPAMNTWFTGRATILDDQVGVINETVSPTDQVYSFEYDTSHGFPSTSAGAHRRWDDCLSPESHWVAFRKDPIVHPGQALSVVRLTLPDNPTLKAKPAHKPPPSDGRYSLPLVSIVDSLPSVQELYARFYTDTVADDPIKVSATPALDRIVKCDPAEKVPRKVEDSTMPLEPSSTGEQRESTLALLDLTQYEKFPTDLPTLRQYARVYTSGLTFPYGGEKPNLDEAGDAFKHRYCVLLDYMLAHAPKELFSQIRMRGIYFVKKLTYGGHPSKTLVVPSAGVILVNVTELTRALDAANEHHLLKALTHKVSRVLHEIAHLCDYRADPDGWLQPDSMLEFMLPDYKFPPNRGGYTPVSQATRCRLPNHMLYAATAPEEFRAESLADLWMSEGPARDQQKQAKAYWEARSRGVVPALYAMLRGGFQAPATTHPVLPNWGRDALFLYRIGDHREATPISTSLKEPCRELVHCQATFKTRHSAWGPPAFAGEPIDLTDDLGEIPDPPLWQVRMDQELAAAQPEETRREQPPDYTTPPYPEDLQEDDPDSGLTSGKQKWTRRPEWRGDSKRTCVAAAAKHFGAAVSLNKMKGRPEGATERVSKILNGAVVLNNMRDPEEISLDRAGVWRGRSSVRRDEYHGGSRFLSPEVRDDPHPYPTSSKRNQGRDRPPYNKTYGCSPIGRNRIRTNAHGLVPGLAEASPRSFLEDLAGRYADTLRLTPQRLAEIEVRFDIKGEHSGQRHVVRVDLDESAAILLYQIVLQVVGHVSRNMLTWRLVGGRCRVNFESECSGHRANLQNGSSYALVGRMQGGGDEPLPLDSPESFDEPAPEAGHLDQSPLSLLDALPATPAQPPTSGGGPSSQNELPSSSEAPLLFSPPYRPLGGDAGVEPAERRAEEASPRGPAIPLQVHRQRGENPAAIPAPSATATSEPAPHFPPTTPSESTRVDTSEIPTPPEPGPSHAEPLTPHVGEDGFDEEVQRRADQVLEAHIQAEVQCRVDAEMRIYAETEIETRLEAEMQRRLPAQFIPTLEQVGEGISYPQPEGLREDVRQANTEPSSNRSVYFGSAPRPNPATATREEPASLPHRPRSERAPGTETRWQHFQNGGPDPKWDDEPAPPSRQSSARSESPSTPQCNAPPTHSPGIPAPSAVAATSARAARRGATGSKYSVPNDNNGAALEDTLSYWEREESTTFTDAPSENTMRRYFERHQVDPAVIELVARVRHQPWQANTASPHTNCFNPNLERPPLRQKDFSTKRLSETRISQKDFKFFNDPKLTAPTELDQLNAWIKVRAEMCITLRTCVDTRCAGPEFLPAIRDELNRLLGHTQALPQLAALIVQGLQTFVTLASNCLLLACDNHFCPEYSPLTALQTVQRKPGQALVDLFANIELLMLQSKNQEQEGRDFLYETMRHTDRQIIPDLHRYAVQAIESGDQPWAAEVALALDRACTNARAFARTVSERDRPAVLQLQAIAFTAGVIGLDQNLSLGYRNGGQPAYGSYDREDPLHLARQPRVRGARTRNTVAPVTTRSAGPPPRMQQQQQPPLPLQAPQPQPPPPPPPPQQQLQHLRPMDQPTRPAERQAGYQPAEPRRGNANPSKPEMTTTNLWIDMAEIRRAAEESDPVRKRLATMIWPSSDCSRFAADIECKATPVFETDGKPAYFNDGRPMVTFNNRNACRFCSIWAAKPGNVDDWKSWPQEVQDGQHNPKVCPRSVAALLKSGNAGASFLKERWGKKPTRPEGGQRRAGQ